jgi:hypothetical protein
MLKERERSMSIETSKIQDEAGSVNFREIRVGSIAPNMLYRSSHPIQDNRQEPVIALLAAKYRIAAVINLSDTNADLKTKSVFAPWYNRLLKNGRVIALGMSFDFTNDSCNRKLKKVLQFIIKTEGPWLIHCHAGVDRTDFFSMVLEALMGATIKEIADDYLMSFNSIFESSIYDHDNKADVPIVMRLLSVMGGDLAINDQNLQSVAEQYLRNITGLEDTEIDLLKNKLDIGIRQPE